MLMSRSFSARKPQVRGAKFVRAVLVCVAVLSLPVPAVWAWQVPSVVARETVELLIRKFGKEAVEESGEKLAGQIDNVVARFGDDGLEAIQKAGPKAVRMLDEAGDVAPQMVKWLAKHGDAATWVVANPRRLGLASQFGDDAVEAMVKLGEPAEKLLEVGGASAAKAVVGLSSRHARQLAMLADEAADASLVRNSGLMDVVAKYGDRGMDFVWRNKGALAVGTVLAAVLANPEPFIEGTRSIAEVAATTAVAPLARGVAGGTNWTVVIVTIALLFFAWYALKQWLNRKRVAKASLP